jgi:hypothetical protein
LQLQVAPPSPASQVQISFGGYLQPPKLVIVDAVEAEHPGEEGAGGQIVPVPHCHFAPADPGRQAQAMAAPPGRIQTSPTVLQSPSKVTEPQPKLPFPPAPCPAAPPALEPPAPAPPAPEPAVPPVAPCPATPAAPP